MQRRNLKVSVHEHWENYVEYWNFFSHIRGPRSEKGVFFVTHHVLSTHRDEHPVYSPFSYGKG